MNTADINKKIRIILNELLTMIIFDPETTRVTTFSVTGEKEYINVDMVNWEDLFKALEEISQIGEEYKAAIEPIKKTLEAAEVNPLNLDEIKIIEEKIKNIRNIKR